MRGLSPGCCGVLKFMVGISWDTSCQGDNSFTLRFNLSRLAPFVFKCKNAFTWELWSSAGGLGQLVKWCVSSRGS